MFVLVLIDFNYGEEVDIVKPEIRPLETTIIRQLAVPCAVTVNVIHTVSFLHWMQMGFFG